MKKIIYDFGACRGENIDYYLLKSDLVVAFEANPNNSKYIQEKFKQAILDKKLLKDLIRYFDKAKYNNYKICYIH